MIKLIYTQLEGNLEQPFYYIGQKQAVQYICGLVIQSFIEFCTSTHQ